MQQIVSGFGDPELIEVIRNYQPGNLLVKYNRTMLRLNIKVASALMIVVLLLRWTTNVRAQVKQSPAIFTLLSPDGKLKAVIDTHGKLSLQLIHESDTLLKPSQIGIEVFANNAGGTTLPKIIASKKLNNVHHIINSPFYKKAALIDHYNELTLFFKGNWNLTFRLYDEGLAYRFATTFSSEILVKHETGVFGFADGSKAYIPYVKSTGELTLERQFHNSFENTYTCSKVSEMDTARLAFLPLLTEVKSGKKLLITEADLENYPGMYLQNKEGHNQLTAVFAPYPKTVEQGGYNQLQLLVKEREHYIAQSTGVRNFPWRVFAVAAKDQDLLENDMVYKLATPSKIKDPSWIKPGKVAWDWWNAWNLHGVDFRTGINNDTYKYYIDFAAKSGLEYVLLDEGWSVNLQYDLKQVVPSIDLKALIKYANEKNVGIILWAGYYAFERDMEEVCRLYSEMGIKGFKIDFMDRDDQLMVDFFYRAASTAAKYKLLVDFHGSYKPTGLQRTYPNVLNFEGVHGMEQMKWSDIAVDQVTYDVIFPFIRMVAGPVDYTQGAMRNATKDNYRAISSEAMSQGTRCRQLAAYIVFHSPLVMLCDSPSNYEAEPACTDFIAKIPTVWDTSLAISGKIGDHILVARQKKGTWYIGGLNNWEKKSLDIELSFLRKGDFEAEIFMDGINADRVGKDYKRKTILVSNHSVLKLDMAPGGGFAIRLTEIK
ncbi:glycoside hydrolase family 97 protein [Niabella aquatica]